MPVDARGELEKDPFSFRVTKARQVLISRGGRQISVLAGGKAEKLLRRIAAASGERERQLILAKATGNYRRGNEGRLESRG
jgi:hypothetical protein